jgi:hypothetical protein
MIPRKRGQNEPGTTKKAKSCDFIKIFPGKPLSNGENQYIVLRQQRKWKREGIRYEYTQEEQAVHGGSSGRNAGADRSGQEGWHDQGR